MRRKLLPEVKKEKIMTWIKINEKLPRKYAKHYFATEEKIYYGWWHGEESGWLAMEDGTPCYQVTTSVQDVTHWYPKPCPPKES